MGIVNEVAEVAVKTAAKETAEDAARSLIRKGATLQDAYTAALKQAGVQAKTTDVRVIEAQMAQRAALRKEAEEAAKKAAAEKPAPPEPKIDESKLDLEDLAAELKGLKPGESGSYRLPNVGADVHVTRHDIHPSNAGKATQEGINRYAQEKAAGQYRVVLNQNGTLGRLIGVDSADAVARQGQVIVQRGIGAQEWTPISLGPDIHPSHVKGILARAAAGLAAIAAAGAAGASESDMNDAYIKAMNNGSN